MGFFFEISTLELGIVAEANNLPCRYDEKELRNKGKNQ